jgi:hypothetical protein
MTAESIRGCFRVVMLFAVGSKPAQRCRSMCVQRTGVSGTTPSALSFVALLLQGDQFSSFLGQQPFNDGTLLRVVFGQANHHWTVAIGLTKRAKPRRYSFDIFQPGRRRYVRRLS